MTTYFVSYHHTSPGKHGFGYSEVTASEGINNIDDVKAIAEQIRDDLGCEFVAILNWKEIDAREPAPGAERKGDGANV